MALTDVSNDTTQENGDDGRLKQYKNLGKHEELRRRRTECSVEIRKQKNADLLMKRRNLQIEEDDENNASEVSDGEIKPVVQIPRMTNAQIIEVLSSNPTLEQMQTAFEALRRSLSKTKNPPVDEVIQSGLLAALVQGLSVEDDKVKFEAAWSLTNIVSGTTDQTIAAVKAGAVKPLVSLCMSTSEALAEQAMWAVANIAGDSAQLRDYIIECGGVEALLHLVEHLDKMTITFARTLAWAYSNLCRHKNPHAPLPVLKVLSKGLAKLIAHSDKQVRQDSCWAVSYLTDGPDEQIALAAESGVLNAMLAFLREPDAMVAPALRVLGNMATGNDELTQIVIDLGTLQELVPLADRARSTSVVKECCWLVSNVIAGTQPQIQAVLDAGIMPLLIEVLRTGDFKCQYEACWAVANLCQGGTSAQVYTLVQDRAVPVLCNLLSQNNVDMLANSLESLYTILTTVASSYPERLDDVKDSMEDGGGLELLEKLQENQSEKIYHLAYRLVADFFGDEDNLDDSEDVGGGVDENKEFTF